MADPKYANLPGIAYDQPDFYETSDLPESDQYANYNEPEEENIAIEKVHLNPEAASEFFRGKYLDGRLVDFSDRITKPRRQRGYDAQTLWELAAAGEPETALQNEETIAEVEKADIRTAYLINKLIEAGIYDQVNLILLSDHGMKEVTQQRIIYLDTLIDADELLEAKYGSTPVLQLIPKEGKEDELYNTLTELSNDYDFTICYAFDDFNATISNINERWGLEANETREYGVHGYSNAAAPMRPFLIAHGPAFQKGFEVPPIKNVDILPLISAILRIPEAPNNGSLERVELMLKPNVLSRSSGANIIQPLQILVTIASILKMFY